jgi:hypothetical protein
MERLEGTAHRASRVLMSPTRRSELLTVSRAGPVVLKTLRLSSARAEHGHFEMPLTPTLYLHHGYCVTPIHWSACQFFHWSYDQPTGCFCGIPVI